MECLFCFQIERKEKSSGKEHGRDGKCTNIAWTPVRKAPSDKVQSKPSYASKQERQDRNSHIAARMFTFRDLATATKNFKPECLVGEGGFGRVYKGRLGSGKVVAVKQLDRNGVQGSREFLVEVLMLSLLHHPNLVSLIGYCADGDQRLLVYEFLPLGSLEDHLHDLSFEKEPLCWNTRMKIAAGAARGLEYLHDKASPPVIYRDLKSSNILLDEGYYPKLSDFGLAKLGPVGDNTHVSTRVMGTYGYCAPEYATTGQLTLKSDVYSFGVVLLELITGRRAIDNSRPSGEHNLVAWARPLFKDRRKLASMADPLLQGSFPMRGLFQALAVAAMCLQEQAATRPLIADVVNALTYLASQFYDPARQSVNNSTVAAATHSQGREEQAKNNIGGSTEGDQTVQGNNNLTGSRSLSHHSVPPVCNKKSCLEQVNGLVNLDKDISGGFAERADDCFRLGRNQNHERASVPLNNEKKVPASCQDRHHALTEARGCGNIWTDRRRWPVGIQKEQV